MSNQPQRGDKSPHDGAVTIDGEYIGPLAYVAVASKCSPANRASPSKKPGDFRSDRRVDGGSGAIHFDVASSRAPTDTARTARHA